MKIESTENFGIDRVKVFVYGPSGSGKTYLAKSIPGSGLIISAEAGLLSLRGTKIPVIDITKNDKGDMIPKEKRIERLGEVFSYLNTPEAVKLYDWIFLDSLTEVAQNLVEMLAIEFPERKEALPMWGEYNKRLRSIIKSFRDIPHYHVVMTALSSVEKDENLKSVHFVDINGKIATQIPQYFDEVFFCELSEANGEKKVTIRTCNTDKSTGKDRSGTLLPMESGDMGVIFKKIIAGKGNENA